MLGIERDLDSELVRVWHLIHELSEQLAHNQQTTVKLQNQANALKVRTLTACVHDRPTQAEGNIRTGASKSPYFWIYFTAV